VVVLVVVVVVVVVVIIEVIIIAVISTAVVEKEDANIHSMKTMGLRGQSILERRAALAQGRWLLDQFDKCHFKNEIRRIGTAKQGEFIHSTGSINLPKPLGNLLVVPAASKTLLAVKNFSENGITTIFHSVQDGGKCDLSSGGKVFQSISPSANGLFYVSL
jgi:hypothetical protein